MQIEYSIEAKRYAVDDLTEREMRALAAVCMLVANQVSSMPRVLTLACLDTKEVVELLLSIAEGYVLKGEVEEDKQ